MDTTELFSLPRQVKTRWASAENYAALPGAGAQANNGRKGATGWGQGQYAHLWHGCPLADHERMHYSFYRLHGPDPIFFHQGLRVTIQQIGCYEKTAILEHMRQAGIDALVSAGDGRGRLTQADVAAGPQYNLFEREDDWCSTAYFYLDRPVNELPGIAAYEERVAVYCKINLNLLT